MQRRYPKTLASVLLTILSMALAHAQSGRAVNLVFRRADAASINFTAGARQIVIQTNPAAVVQTNACGSAGYFPVQNVFVMDKLN